MKKECSDDRFSCKPLGRREVVARFDGGDITSDGGALLLRELEAELGIIRRFAECFTDHRDPARIEHTVEELVAQRVNGLALGYEDLNDHDSLRHDPMLAVLVGKTDPKGETRGARPRQGPGRQEHAEPPGAHARGRHEREALQAEGQAPWKVRPALTGVEDRPRRWASRGLLRRRIRSFAPEAAAGDHARPRRHGRSPSREAGGPLLPRLLHELLLPAVVHLLRGPPACGEAEALVQRVGDRLRGPSPRRPLRVRRPPVREVPRGWPARRRAEGACGAQEGREEGGRSACGVRSHVLKATGRE